MDKLKQEFMDELHSMRFVPFSLPCRFLFLSCHACVSNNSTMEQILEPSKRSQVLRCLLSSPKAVLCNGATGHLIVWTTSQVQHVLSLWYPRSYGGKCIQQLCILYSVFACLFASSLWLCLALLCSNQSDVIRVNTRHMLPKEWRIFILALPLLHTGTASRALPNNICCVDHCCCWSHSLLT